jgi:hypothetical protein
VGYHGLLAQVGAEKVDDFMTDRVEPIAGALAGINLNQVVAVVSLTDGSFLAELPINNPDAACLLHSYSSKSN